MQGYRAAYVAPRRGSALWPAGMTMILERLPGGAQAPEYVLVEEKNGSAIHYLLDDARKGFRYVRNSAFVHRGHDFWEISGRPQFSERNTSGTRDTTRSRITSCWN